MDASGAMKTILLSLIIVLGLGARATAVDSLYESRKKADPPAVYQDQNLTALQLDHPISIKAGSSLLLRIQ